MKKELLSILMALIAMIIPTNSWAQNIIQFEDNETKAICVANWDTNGDGELSFDEAAAVTEINEKTGFAYQSHAKTFNEFRYFTGLTTINSNSFHQCELNSIHIPSNVTTIGSGAFDETSLTTTDGGQTDSVIVIPDGVTTLGWEAFAVNEGFKSAIIPASVTDIAGACFRTSPNLKTFIVDPQNRHFSVVNNLLIKDGTTVVSCPHIDSDLCEVPEGVEEIITYSFYGMQSRFTELILPSTLKNIGSSNFFGNLTKLTCKAVEPPVVGNYVFNDNLYTSTVLYVPYGTKAAYQAAEIWSNFQNIEELANSDSGDQDGWIEQLENGDAEKPWANPNTRWNDTNNNYKICAWGKTKGRNMTEDGDGWNAFPADIEEEEGTNGNHVFVVHAANADTEGDASAWDNQFWIQSPHAWESGTEIRIRFRYKASKDVVSVTQLHKQNPSDYHHYVAIGDIAFTTEWQEFDGIMTIDDRMEGCWSIAFNLNSQEKTATDFYFDDLSWSVRQGSVVEPKDAVAVSLINNGDMEGEENSNFYYRYLPETTIASLYHISDGVGVNDSRGIMVETTEMVDNTWDSEFWISLNQPVSEGTRYRMSFDYRADKETDVPVNVHGPAFFGDYIWQWNDPYIYYGTEWQTYTQEGTIRSAESSDQKPLSSFSFVLNDYTSANTYYFDNVKFEVFLDDQCPKPTFIQKEEENEVSIHSPFDATIYYTLDGKEPTTSSSVYTAPLSFTQSTTIMAIAVVDGYEVSPVATYLFEPAEDNLDQEREELIAMIYQLAQEADVCYKELGMKDPDQTSNLWKDLYAIEDAIATVRVQTEEATTEEQLDDCRERIYQIANEVDRLRKEIEMYASIITSFDGLTAYVSGSDYLGGPWLDLAFESVGGREVAAKTIAAIIWESTTPLTADMLEGIDNPNLLVYVNEASLAPQGVQNVVINGQAKEIILTNATTGNNNFFCPQPFRAEKISYTRNFSQQTEVGVSRGWEGIALPFNVQTITHETKGTITPFGSGNGKHFWLRAYDGEKMYSAREMEAYAPYVIAMPNSDSYFADYNLNGRVTFSATNTEVYRTPDFSDMENEPGMPLMTIPAFQRKAQSDSIYAINVGQARGGHAEGSVFEAGLREVRPFEVYTVHHGQGARPRYIPIPAQGNETTGIKDIENSALDNEPWYSLDGRKLSGEPKTKGVYIQNGKKQIVR